MRRRLRYLRKLRELQVRDLGGLVFDLRRFERKRDDLVAQKIDQIRACDDELHALELGARRAARPARRARAGHRRHVPALLRRLRQRRQASARTAARRSAAPCKVPPPRCALAPPPAATPAPPAPAPRRSRPRPLLRPRAPSPRRARRTRERGPAVARTPGALLCPRCGNTLRDDQGWCLECGLAARTRVHPPPSWRVPVVLTCVLLALLAAGIAVALVTLLDTPESTPAPTTVTVPAATTPRPTTPSATVPTTTAPHDGPRSRRPRCRRPRRRRRPARPHALDDAVGARSARREPSRSRAPNPPARERAR